MSWQQRFFEIRVPFFVGNLALVAITLASRAMFSAYSAAVAPVMLLGLVAIVGLATRDLRAHAVLVVAALLIQAAGLGGAFFVTQAP